MTDHFSTYHPVTNFCYFAAVLGLSMVCLHPVFLFFSAAGAFLYACLQRGRRTLWVTAGGLLPLLLFSVFLNMAFNHQGATILTYLPSGNPLTAESLWFGLCAAVMFVSVIGWCTCLTAVMTTDKMIFLLGRPLPSISLLISMILSFLPRCRRQFSAVYTAQKQLLADPQNRRAKGKLAFECLSILLTHTLETSVDTADSMRARGFGSGRRTSCALFRFRHRDILVLCFLLTATAFLLFSRIYWGDFVTFFPLFRLKFPPAFYPAAAIYGIVCFLPAIIHVMEEKKWNKSKSGI